MKNIVYNKLLIVTFLCCIFLLGCSKNPGEQNLNKEKGQHQLQGTSQYQEESRSESLLYNQGQSQSENQSQVQSGSQPQNQSESQTQNQSQSAWQDEERPENTEQQKEDVSYCFLENVVEKDGDVYFIAGNYLFRANREAGETQMLYETTSNVHGLVNKVLLHDDWIYFLGRNEKDYYANAIYRVRIDGSVYELMLSLDGYSIYDFYISGDTLYYESFEEQGYIKLNDPSLGANEKEIIKNVEIESENVVFKEFFASVNEENVYNSYLADKWNIRLAETEDRNIICASTDGKILWKLLPALDISHVRVISVEYPYMVVSGYTDRYDYYIVDMTDGSVRKMQLAVSDATYEEYGIYDEKFYYALCPSREENLPKRYMQYDLVGDKVTELFWMEECDGGEWEDFYEYGFCVKADKVYYFAQRDGEIRLYMRNLDTLEECAVSDVVWQTSPPDVGKVIRGKNVNECPICGYKMWIADVEGYIVDAKYTGAKAINEILQERYQSSCTMMDSFLEDDIDIEHKAHADGAWFTYSIESDIDVTQISQEYISIREEAYVYTGGAHGYPYREEFLFNLNTGEKLELQDVVACSEEEWKEIMCRYFQSLIDEEPGQYWSDAIQIVQEHAGFDCNYYIKENGIEVYFYPYDIASYARSFVSVEIPYEECGVKLDFSGY